MDVCDTGYFQITALTMPSFTIPAYLDKMMVQCCRCADGVLYFTDDIVNTFTPRVWPDVEFARGRKAAKGLPKVVLDLLSYMYLCQCQMHISTIWAAASDRSSCLCVRVDGTEVVALFATMVVIVAK